MISSNEIRDELIAAAAETGCAADSNHNRNGFVAA